jgi:Cu-processing system ATP-binding protein
MISLQGITKRYGRLQVLNGISGELEGGSVVSLIGPNASGKTTLIKCMLGLVRPDSGKVLLGGKDIAADASVRSKLGYMPQIGKYPENMKVGQVFDLLRQLRGNAAKVDEELIESFQLRTQFEKPFRALSGGTVQKVSACIAFLFDPPVLILDEPTAGLDPLASEILKEKIHRSHAAGKLVLITSHILSDLDDITGHILYLQEGKVRFFKPMAEVMAETGESRIDKAIARVMRDESNH